MYKKSIFLFLFCFISSCASNYSTQVKKDKSLLFYNRGTHHLIKQEYSKALKYMLLAYKENPDDSKILNNLGMAYYFKKKFTHSKKFLKRSIEIDPKNTDAINNLASISFTQGNFAQAKIYYQKALKDLVYEKSFRVYYNLALIDLKEGNVDLAISKLHQVYKLKDDYCTANFQLGKIYSQRFMFKKALIWFHRAQKNECYKNPMPRYQYGVTLATMGRNKDAITIFQSLVESFPNTRFEYLAKMKMNEISSIIEDNPLVFKKKYKEEKKSAKNLPIFNSPSF